MNVNPNIRIDIETFKQDLGSLKDQEVINEDKFKNILRVLLTAKDEQNFKEHVWLKEGLSEGQRESVLTCFQHATGERTDYGVADPEKVYGKDKTKQPKIARLSEDAFRDRLEKYADANSMVIAPASIEHVIVAALEAENIKEFGKTIDKFIDNNFINAGRNQEKIKNEFMRMFRGSGG